MSIKKILLIMFLLIICSSSAMAKTDYKKLSQKYNISECLLMSLDEHSVKFNATDSDCRELQIMFEKYQEVYLVLMVFELGEKNACRLYDKGKYTDFALKVCETSEKYERQQEQGITPKNKPKRKPKPKKKYVGEYLLTAYCACSRCCGHSTGKTASGTTVSQGRTIATGSQFAFGTKLQIEGMGTRIVEDRGVTGNVIDVFFNSHREALIFGTKRRKVWLICQK